MTLGEFNSRYEWYCFKEEEQEWRDLGLKDFKCSCSKCSSEEYIQNDLGYLIVYEDGTEGWTPKCIFEIDNKIKR